ncbi:MAG: hypothetical protein WDO13_07755 [Verrucomicrobiota bacterium]
MRLVIKPQVTADNKTIDLSLFPEVTDFEGFINYGSPIDVANPDGSPLAAVQQRNQPAGPSTPGASTPRCSSATGRPLCSAA